MIVASIRFRNSGRNNCLSASSTFLRTSSLSSSLPVLKPEKPIRDQYRHFIVDERKMALTNNGVFSHCLPLRRNVKATDGVMDSPQCIAIDEAENRLHVQKAIMSALVKARHA